MKKALLISIFAIFCLGNSFAQTYSEVKKNRIKIKEYRIDTIAAMYQDISYYYDVHTFLLNFNDVLYSKLFQYNINARPDINTPDSIGNLCDIKIENLNTLMHITYNRLVLVYTGIAIGTWAECIVFDFEIISKKNNRCIPVFKTEIIVALDDLLIKPEKIVDKIIKQLIKLKYIENLPNNKNHT